MVPQELHRCADINKDMPGSYRVEGNSSAAIQPAVRSSHPEVSGRRQTYPEPRACTYPVKSLHLRLDLPTTIDTWRLVFIVNNSVSEAILGSYGSSGKSFSYFFVAEWTE